MGLLLRVAPALGASLLVLLPGQESPPRLPRCLAAKPVVRWNLPPLLREVSGLALTEDGRLFAHNDDLGFITEIDYQHGKLGKTFFLGNGALRDDFEGIAIVGPRFFLITSSGRLYETVEGPDRARVPSRVTVTGVGRQCEIEGLASDPKARLLYIACKNPRVKALENSVAIFRWSLDQNRLADPSPLLVPVTDLARGTPGKGFHASGIELDPLTGHFVLVAGIEEAIAEIDQNGKVLATAKLPGHHPQPEGITITKDGTLIVSDEGPRGPGTVTVYSCK